MSTSTIIILPNNTVSNQPAQNPVKQTVTSPLPPAAAKALGPQKDSYVKRQSYGFLGLGAVVTGVFGLFKSFEAEKKFFQAGRSGEIFQKAGSDGILKLHVWNRAIKANPKAFWVSVAIDVASWSGIFLGAAWMQRGITGHKKEKRKDK